MPLSDLASDESDSGSKFGISVALDGEVLVVGARGDDNAGGSDAGAVYVFVRDAGSGAWSEAQKLLASDGSQYDLFGISVALEGDRALVGASSDDNAGGSSAGAAYVLERQPDGSWAQVAKLLADDGAASDVFGQFLDRHASLDAPHVGLAQDQLVKRDIPRRGQGDFPDSFRHQIFSTTGAGSHSPDLISRHPQTNTPFPLDDRMVAKRRLNSC